MPELYNFMPIENKLPWRRTILFVDDKEHNASQKLNTANAPYCYKATAIPEDNSIPFVLVLVSFNKKYTEKIADGLLAADLLFTLKYGQEYLDHKSELNTMFPGAWEAWN